jgi:hypothetical protein
MKNLVIPFCTGSEAMEWESNNCDQCSRARCYPKKAIQMGYISGKITLKVADFIGIQKVSDDDIFITLNDKCNHFNIPNPYKSKHIENKNQLNLKL